MKYNAQYAKVKEGNSSSNPSVSNLHCQQNDRDMYIIEYIEYIL